MTKTWQEYEAGKEYKRRIGLYERTRTNERFYRGEQWTGQEGTDLPKPVFNLVKRIVDYLVCTVASGKYVLNYTDENLPFNSKAVSVRAIKKALEVLTGNARYRWERCKMDSIVYGLLLDAALTGDGAVLCYWDNEAEGDRVFRGDIGLQRIDGVNLFAADMNRADIQSQEYIIVSGRASVESLRREARENGATAAEAAHITADSDNAAFSGDMAYTELNDGEGKATYLLKFWREDGRVVYEKSTRERVIRRGKTDMRLYPVAYFSWMPVKNSFHGASPVSGMLPNQRYINMAYALAMKHMISTAFSKIVYDKSRIPEWSNEVGEAIGVIGATNVGDAISVVEVGAMQDGYLELIDRATSVTKELSGATETALGNTNPTNTSAILALKETARMTLEQVTSALATCVEDVANIWADMMCAYYSDERLVPFRRDGEERATRLDLSVLRDCLVRARVDVTETARYSDSAAIGILDKLLDGGYITAAQYTAHLPEGLLADRDLLAGGDIGTKGGDINGEGTNPDGRDQ